MIEAIEKISQHVNQGVRIISPNTFVFWSGNREVWKAEIIKPATEYAAKIGYTLKESDGVLKITKSKSKNDDK